MNLCIEFKISFNFTTNTQVSATFAIMVESRTKINMAQLDAEGKLLATNQIINMFQRPGQLEKVEQFKRTHLRKKASVEAKLKSGMQSQLDGVRVGLNQLHICLQDIKEVEVNLKSINSLFVDVPKLFDRLREVREENMRHSQYVTAIENLKHIFTVPESVEKTKHWINEGKLLHAHQCLRDLENSRDELLLELHKLPNQSPHDTSMLKAYFEEVENLSKMLEKQLRLVVSRTLNTVRKEPTIIVTALRIIEREEKSDSEMQNNRFMPPGRPKRWKFMAFDVLKNSVATRIEGTQIEEKEDNKLWLVRYLELTRQLILEDLRVVKTLCVPCFPPHYNIINKFVQWYHEGLSKHLHEIVQDGLEGNEYVSILAWTLNTYTGEELMGHPDLKPHTANIGSLLTETALRNLQSQYLRNMESNYIEWMQNTLKTEREEWYSKKQPQSDTYLRTAAPVILFQMIDQNLQVTKTISQKLTYEALTLSMNQIIGYADAYKEAIVAFKNKHFEDRSQLPYFTQYMITIVNNCHQITELASQFELQYKIPGTPYNISELFKNLKEKYISLRNESGNYLLEEVFLDLDKHFDEIFTLRWLYATLPVDTICVTLEDYFHDYNRLVEDNFKYIIGEAVLLIAKKYVVAMLSKRVSYKMHEECQAAALKVVKEVHQMRDVFLSIASKLDDDNPLDTVVFLTDILKCEDDMLSLDLHRVVEKYPDITEDHLLRLLYLRGDLPRSELREKVAYVLRSSNPRSLPRSSIFKHLVFPKLVNLGFS